RWRSSRISASGSTRDSRSVPRSASRTARSASTASGPSSSIRRTGRPPQPDSIVSTDNRDDSGTGRAGRRVSRREFLRLAGVAAAAAGATTLPGVRDARAEDAPKFDMEVDVVVVGSGAAGSVAAIFAHEAGAKVALVE